MGGQPEGMHLVSKMTEGRISSQVVDSRGTEKAMLEEEQSVTLSDEKGCFACNERSHNLDQCKIKYKHVYAAHQFSYATKFPFTVIQPSDEMVEKKKLHHHCVLIKSNVTNLDKGILKDELKMFWKLSDDWELRRECSMTFLASFGSEGDVISCLKNPNIETLLNNKKVKLTVTRWKEGDYGSLDLVEEWLLLRGVPKIYRNWKELYQVASAFGVLTDVDERSLEVGDKEPIRLKTAFRSFDGAPFSYYFAFGWPSKLVMVTVEQDKAECMKHKNKLLDKEHKKDPNAATSILLEESKGIEESRSNGKAKGNKISAPTTTIINSEIRTITESSKPEGVQSIAPTPRSMIGEEHFRGIQKPPIKHVFKRRAKKQQVTEAINKSPSNKMDKDVAPHSSSNAKTIAATGCDKMDEKDCSKMELKRELNIKEITPMEESKKSEKFGASRETEYNNVAAPTINSKKSQLSRDTSRSPEEELITRHTKGVGMDKMGSDVQVHTKEEASHFIVQEEHTDLLVIQQLAETLNVSMEDAEKIYTGEKEIAMATVAYKYKEGKDLMATKREIQELPTAMRQLHDYYLVDTIKSDCVSFGVCIPKHYIFEKEEEETQWVEYAALFQLFQRRDLDLQIMMMWTTLEAKYCLKKGLNHIAFLDPMQVNENTCKGINCDVKDLVDELTKIFYRIKHKSNILLAYNCKNHYILVDIKLAESRVEVWDSKRRELSQIIDLLKVLNDVKQNMDEDRMIQFEAHYMEAHTLEQPMANNECGFYVMWAMHQYLGRSVTEGNQMRKKLKTQQLLDMEIRGFQDELAVFIIGEVMTREGSFSIWQAKNRSSFDINMF